MIELYIRKTARVILIVLALSINYNSRAQGTITTIAGIGGTGGYGGDGGPATSATFFGAVGIALDASGNIYFADANNNRVRMITASTGIINTIAGNGYGAGMFNPPTGGYTGDGGPADSAELFAPAGVALDAQGNVYICDYANSAIRKVDAVTHIISTVAGGLQQGQGYSGDGGQATLASLDEPDAIALDHAGNIYIADYGNNVIRKVTVATGIITTIVGDGEGAGFGGGSGNYTGDGGPADSASLNGPEGIVVDDAGNIYISDTYNNVIRKVDGHTNIISTFAGDSAAISTGFGGDGFPASEAYFNDVAGLTLDAAGNLYICDEANNVVRRVDVSTNIISSVVGNHTQGFSGDNGPALSAELYGPSTVAFDAAGNMYITDTGNGRIRKVTGHATDVQTVPVNTGLSIYPNPANQQVYLEPSGTGYTGLKIINQLGQEIYARSLDNTNPNERIAINTDKFLNGVYFVELVGQTEVITKQLLIHK